MTEIIKIRTSEQEIFFNPKGIQDLLENNNSKLHLYSFKTKAKHIDRMNYMCYEMVWICRTEQNKLDYQQIEYSSFLLRKNLKSHSIHILCNHINYRFLGYAMTNFNEEKFCLSRLHLRINQLRSEIVFYLLNQGLVITMP